MGFEEEFKKLVKDAAQSMFRGSTDFAHKAGVSQSVLSQLVNDKRKGLQLETVGKLMDAMGISVGKTQKEASREVVFVNSRVVNSEDGTPPVIPEDYLAVPLVSEAGAGPGIISTNEHDSWFLVYRNEPSIRMRSDLIAVRIAKGSTSMEPTLSPGDIVLVDRQDTTITTPGRIWLVMEPDGSGKIKRVKVDDLKQRRQTRLTFYSDNVQGNPPDIYSLEEDYDCDISRAIVGRVVWAWSDVSMK